MSAYKFILRMSYIDDDVAVDPHEVFSSSDPGAMKIAYTAVKNFLNAIASENDYLLEVIMTFE